MNRLREGQRRPPPAGETKEEQGTESEVREMEDLDALLNTGAVPQDERTADFIAESRINRSFCYETAERGALRVA